MSVQQWTLILCISSFSVMIATVLLHNAAKRRRDLVELERKRLEVLQEALQHASLDEALRAELARVLTRNGDPACRQADAQAARGKDWWHLLWFGAGWVLFVVGGCMLGAGAAGLATDVSTKTFLPMTITGFAMLTLPLALRELTARRDAASAPGR